MSVFKKVIFSISICIGFFIHAHAQLAPNTAYTRYGLGNLYDKGNSSNFAMGGLGVGLSETNSINYLNPASYTSIDTMSFILDLGLQSQINAMTSTYGKAMVRNTSPDHFIMGFPIRRKLKASMGILPYSSINYSIENTSSLDEDTLSNTVDGKGGIQDLFLGLSLAPNKNLSVGVNFNYLFGEYYRDRTVIFLTSPAFFRYSIFESIYTLKGLSINLGLQYNIALSEKDNLVIGLRYDPTARLKTIYNYSLKQQNEIDTATVKNEKLHVNTVIPQRFSGGITWVHDQKLIAGVDFIYQNWDKTKIAGKQDSLGTYYSLRAGLEYTPVSLSDIRKVSYLKHITLRLGTYYTQTYYDLQNTAIKDAGFTLGLGFPMKDFRKLYSKTSFNITYGLGFMGTENNGLIANMHQTIMLGITLHDIWFIKPKYN